MSVNAADPTLAPRADALAEAGRFAVVSCLATVALGGLAEVLGAVRPAAVAGAAIAQALFLTFAIARMRPEDAPVRLGTANRITIARSTLVALFGALAIDPPRAALVLWALVLVAIVALVLDGLDGAAARREGTASRFGAWLDQEIDALFVLALSVFVWRSGEAGGWIVAAGAWRYVFLALVAIFPRLRGELPYSQRRRVVCVVQLGVLVGCVAPIIEPPISTALAALSLAMLSSSFLVDLARMWRRPAAVVSAGPPRSRTS